MSLGTRSLLAVTLLGLAVSATAQATSITELIESVSKRTGKNFIVDPRVQGEVTLVGKDLATLSYSDLLAVLQVHGYIAVDRGSYALIVPDANARMMGAPVISDKESVLTPRS